MTLLILLVILLALEILNGGAPRVRRDLWGSLSIERTQVFTVMYIYVMYINIIR